MSNNVIDWLKKSRQDLESAQILFDHEGFPETIIFLCQQAVEKALKGTMVAYQLKLIKTHDLLFLSRQVASYDRYFASEDIQGYCQELSDYYIETRYPLDISFEITMNDAERMLMFARQVMNHLATHLVT